MIDKMELLDFFVYGVMHNAHVYQTIFFERTKCDLPNCGALYEHHTNLVVQTLSKMGIMGKIKNVSQGFYDFFFS